MPYHHVAGTSCLIGVSLHIAAGWGEEHLSEPSMTNMCDDITFVPGTVELPANLIS